MNCLHNFVERETAVTADGMCPLCLVAENERLRAALQWTGQVRPGRNPESGGAIVHMTWEEFNIMRECIGLKAQPVPRK